jgi:hypothetical protein
MTTIKRPSAAPFSPLRQAVDALKDSRPTSPQLSEVKGPWLPKVVKTPQRSKAVDDALYATADAVRGGLQKGLEVTKKVNEATAGPRTESAEGYKYRGAIEVGLEALNRTFEGGGVDVKKGLEFIEKNAKKK